MTHITVVCTHGPPPAGAGNNTTVGGSGRGVRTPPWRRRGRGDRPSVCLPRSSRFVVVPADNAASPSRRRPLQPSRLRSVVPPCVVSAPLCHARLSYPLLFRCSFRLISFENNDAVVIVCLGAPPLNLPSSPQRTFASALVVVVGFSSVRIRTRPS